MITLKDNYRSNEMNKYIGLLGLICLTRRFFVEWVLVVIKIVPVIGQYNTIIFDVLISILVVLGISSIRREYSLQDIVFLFVCFLSCLVSMIHPENQEYLSEGVPIFLLKAVPYYFLGRVFKINSDISILGVRKKGHEWMYLFSIIGVLVNVLYYFYNLRLGREVMENSSASTNTLIPVCYLVFYTFYNKRILSGIVALVGSLAMIAYGVRTNILAIIVMIVIMLFLSLKNGRKKMFVIATTILGSAFLYFNFDSVILSLEIMFLRMGITNRFFNLFHSEGLSYLSGRGDVWNVVIEKINEKPLWGYGIFGDRTFFGDFHGYAHNLFLEMLVDFGVIIGGLFVLYFIIIIFKGFTATENDVYSRGIFLSLFCAECVMLMAAGSYLVEGPFFFLIGFSLMCSRNKDIEVHVNQSVEKSL